MRLSALVASTLALIAHASASTSIFPVDQSPTEPAWGRIYLSRGLAPIQYFRDRYGGPMVTREVEFYFPHRIEDRLGCAPLPLAEQVAIRAANGSLALVLDRGVCTFEAKSRLAEDVGAAALVVVSEDESAKAPVALVERGEIEIPSVMIRKSAGDMLRLVSSRERVLGRLIPVTCERKPYVCKARTTVEAEYIAEQSARSGVIIASATNTTLGDFLSASYGSILPSGVLQVPRDVLPVDGCGELDSELFTGKVVLFKSTQSGCSTLEKVSSAQRAGAVVALLAVSESPSAMKHPSVAQSWHAYNITIAVVAISRSTLDRIAVLQQESSEDIEIQFDVRNRIADAWDQVHRLSVKTAWPTRKDRQAKLLERVLGSFDLDDGQLLELKRHYLSVAGGSGSAWDQAFAPHRQKKQPSNHGREETKEVVIEATGM